MLAAKNLAFCRASSLEFVSNFSVAPCVFALKKIRLTVANRIPINFCKSEYEAQYLMCFGFNLNLGLTCSSTLQKTLQSALRKLYSLV